MDEEGKNFDDIKAPIGKSLLGPALSCFLSHFGQFTNSYLGFIVNEILAKS